MLLIIGGVSSACATAHAPNSASNGSPPPPRPAPVVSIGSAPPPAKSAPKPAAKASPQQLVASVRDQGWDLGSVEELLGLGSSGARVLIADFQESVVPSDGIPIGHRRFALFDADDQALATQTIDLSGGGLDQVEHELRDVDGDGLQDLVFYYFREEQWKPTSYGWVAATHAGQVVHAPLSLPIEQSHMYYARACWTIVDHTPIQFVNWHERDIDAEGHAVSLGDRATIYAVDGGGLREVAAYGARLAERANLGKLLSLVPKDHQLPVLESNLVVPDCAPEGPAFLAFPVGNRWQLLTGLSFGQDRVGTDWPTGTPKPAHPTIVDIPKVDPYSWLTLRAPK
jgi:hypothetical protein